MRDRELLLKFRVGLFVSGLLILFVAFVLSIGSQSRLFEDRYRLRASFRDIQGLIGGAPVRLAGLTVGTVSGIAFGRDVTDPRVQVELSIDTSFKSRIRSDSIARISTVGLVGDKVLELTVGTEAGRVLEPGDEVRTEEPQDFSQLVARGARVLENMEGASRSLEAFLETLALPKTRKALGDTLLSLEQITREIQEGSGLLHSLVYERRGAKILDLLDTKGEQILDQLARTADQLAAVATSVQGIMTKVEEGQGLLGALVTGDGRGVVEDMGQAAKRLEGALAAIQEGSGVLHALIYGDAGTALLQDLGEAARHLRGAAERGDRLLSNIEQGEGLLGTLVTTQQGGEVLVDLKRAVRAIREVAERVAEGEGTLGALLQDPTLYEDLSSLLRGAERSRILRGLIRSSIRKGRNQSPPK